MDRFIHLGLAAAFQAVVDSGLPTGDALGDELATRIGCNIGVGIGGLPMIEQTHAELTARGPRRISPFFVPASIINMISGPCVDQVRLQGPQHRRGHGLHDRPACHRPVGAHDRIRRRRRDGRRRRRSDRVAAGHRRLCFGPGAVDSQRRSQDGFAALGQGPRWLRAGRGRRRAGAGGVRARQGARREDLRRAGRFRHERRRLSHDRAGRRRPAPLHGQCAAQCRRQCRRRWITSTRTALPRRWAT